MSISISDIVSFELDVYSTSDIVSRDLDAYSISDIVSRELNSDVSIRCISDIVSARCELDAYLFHVLI